MKKKNLSDLKKIMATLRGPQGCPWDKKQTPQSLTPYAVEEALELEDAIHNKSRRDVIEELGDVLFQVVFQSQMAEEKGDFSLEDVIHDLCTKMVERHPHVFAANRQKMTDQGVSQVWEKNKNKKVGADKIFDFPQNFPALLAAVKVGKKSRTINFDWYKPQEVFQHFLSEVEELRETLGTKDKKHQEEEVGDALFTLAQVSRLLEVDPEKALRQANRKVVRRIRESHQMSGLSWDDYAALSIADKEVLWEEVKKQKKKTAKAKKKSTKASRKR